MLGGVPFTIEAILHVTNPALRLVCNNHFNAEFCISRHNNVSSLMSNPIDSLGKQIRVVANKFLGNAYQLS